MYREAALQLVEVTSVAPATSAVELRCALLTSSSLCDCRAQRGHAYPCFCSAERLAELREQQTRKGLPSLYDRLCASHPPPGMLERIREADAAQRPYVIRMRVPPGSTVVKDALRGSVRFENKALDDGVLLKSDGYPTYHLAVVVDDHHMAITHVIRGEEWMTSAPKHVILYEVSPRHRAPWENALIVDVQLMVLCCAVLCCALPCGSQMFGWRLPVFAHLPLLLNPVSHSSCVDCTFRIQCTG